MTKKRRLSSSLPVKVEIKEENVGNEYLMAKGRLKGVLKQLTEKSSDDESESSDEGQIRRRRGRRTSSPEPENSWDESEVVDVRRLPPPSKAFETRIPSPLPEQLEQSKNNINLDYEECPPTDKNTLIRNHLQRWVKVKKKWIEASAKNEERFESSFKTLQTIYNKAQERADES
ncbi:protein lin-37 homolog isoform X2 [Euwallacea similis]|uniref:protein lin-37 homolog isoform X2 n=1 Tax=Euwallacea similis TaxID=1736056 RepID=UPI00344D5E48